MAACEFEVGGWYRNQRCRYQVVEIDDDVLLVRLDDGSECLLDAPEQAEVSWCVPPPWWADPSDSRRHAAAVLPTRGVTHLYHFTAPENLEGIRDLDAICSKDTLQRLDRWYTIPGGDETSQCRDAARGHWEYVSLSFAWHTPQFFTRLSAHPRVTFCISPEVAGAEDAIIYGTNANSSDTEPFRDLSEALDYMNFERFKRRFPKPVKDSKEWHDIQAEVLIAERVPLDFVERIVVPPQAKGRVAALFGDRFPIAVVNFRQWRYGDPPQPNDPRQRRSALSVSARCPQGADATRLLRRLETPS